LPPSIVALQAANTDSPPSTLPQKPTAAAPAANAGDIKADIRQAVQDASRVAALIRAYRARGRTRPRILWVCRCRLWPHA
jgi:2-oxoglutarate dehydrogenase complex dehydrogenase (E1) component-like enzyme